MKKIEQKEIKDFYGSIYSFLRQTDEKWLTAYFVNEMDFIEFLQDEDVHVLAYRNDEGQICCALILNESSILTAAFDDHATHEQYSTALQDTEDLLRQMHYVFVGYGEGYYSYGIYSSDTKKDPFGEYLKQNGWIKESVSYDVKHDLKALLKQYRPGKYPVRKADVHLLPERIQADHLRFAADDCYVCTDDTGEIVGYAFANRDTCTLDLICPLSKKYRESIDIRHALFFAVAEDWAENGASWLIQKKADQLEVQRIPYAFEICGTYESLSGRIKA